MESQTQQSTNIVGYSDLLLWEKVEDKSGKISRRGIFPFSRYANILNRPQVITDDSSVSDTPNADFHLLVTETEEVSDDVIYKLIGQIW